MKQFCSLSTHHALTKGTQSANSPYFIMVITPWGASVHRISCEEDSDGVSIHRDEPDYDDYTDYGYWKRKQPKKSWSPPGYGDDD